MRAMGKAKAAKAAGKKKGGKGVAKKGRAAPKKVAKGVKIKIWDGVGKLGKPPCPKIGDGPIHYKKGAIYTSAPRKTFRIIRVRGKYETECTSRWEGTKPSDKDWKTALRKLD